MFSFTIRGDPPIYINNKRLSMSNFAHPPKKGNKLNSYEICRIFHFKNTTYLHLKDFSLKEKRFMNLVFLTNEFYKRYKMLNLKNESYHVHVLIRLVFL